ncbi:hypothetical protein [Bacillus phage vB_BsuS_PJN02]|uniref:Uncharacterized protein n=1 Tax=Bacillus phage vB_BsuS_PJN02 TaxID=2920374 RepID=A0AC61TS45_9CAUD|nr:hypothetical protein PQE76_gp177 [Bacillus phage vB_BsuS_PJN02]UNH58520.1 hypothetical protein [Bacillus phage vB_BsuS_PJN02]
MIDSERDIKWVCLNEDCGHVWYDQYEFEYIECPICRCENIEDEYE